VKVTLNDLQHVVMVDARLLLSHVLRDWLALALYSRGPSLRPAEGLIFGDPRAGRPIRQAAQTIGIKLPLTALAWEGEERRTWLPHNKFGWLGHRHGMGSPAGMVDDILRVLAARSAAATDGSGGKL
jgi:Domain of unknown function DUF302